MNGILLVDKPVGWTSFDVVAKVRGIWRAELIKRGESPKKAKVGHTGTLDPAASGLLVLVLGDYTKRATEFSKLDKTYEAELTLGFNSSTGDSEGQLTQVSDRRPTKGEIQEALNSFTGEIMQIPPIHSAIKVQGQRAYNLARKGQEVALEPRQVTIYSLENLQYVYPKVNFTVSVSSGTYIRSLALDIGQKLGIGAYLSALRRTKVGVFDVSKALNVEEIGPNTLLDNQL